MNKAELISAVSERAGLSKKDSEKAVNAVFALIAESLAAGEKVSLVSFGFFELKERKAHIGRNPKTGEAIEIAPSRAASFRPAKALKEAVSDK